MNQFQRIALIAAAVLIACGLYAQTPNPPEGLSAKGYEAHIELRWQANTNPDVSGYQIFRSEDGDQNYSLLKSINSSNTIAIDWTGDEGQALSRHYRMKAVKNNGLSSDFSAAVQAQTQAMTNDELLEMVQEYTFRYFWDYAHPVSGMARERNNGNPETVTTGGSGFGILSLIVGAERGWISRDAAVNRMVQIVSFLQFADRYHGVFPHWMNGSNGNTIKFSQFDDGADLVETAFLLQGLLTAREYFDQNTPLENALRSVITSLWRDVEWDWFRKNNGPDLYWHWSPNYQWAMNFPLRGFYEAQIVYLLATASPTHPAPGSLYQSGWTSKPNYCSSAEYYGHRIYCGGYGGGPMFWAHYSYLGFDPRGWKDPCCNYFIRNRNHALIQWEYAKANPENHKGYGADCWGLTSCDGPNGYSAHDIHPNNDDGTIAPTAALASMPYTPDQSLAALKYFYRTLGENLWGIYGFYDAFNQDLDWFASSYLAIDQGPIVAMIENHRTGLLWNKFMQTPGFEQALLDCGFLPDSTVRTAEIEIPGASMLLFPNPAQEASFTIQVQLEHNQKLAIDLLDNTGKPVRNVLNLQTTPAGEHRFNVDVPGIPPGLYFIKIQNAENQLLVKKIYLPG